MLIKKVRRLRSSGASPSACVADHPVGGRRPQAPRAQPKGQGLQVPPHSHRVAHPPPVALLQDGRRAAAHVEIREHHSQHHGGMRDLGTQLVLWLG